MTVFPCILILFIQPLHSVYPIRILIKFPQGMIGIFRLNLQLCYTSDRCTDLIDRPGLCMIRNKAKKYGKADHGVSLDIPRRCDNYDLFLPETEDDFQAALCSVPLP